MAGERGPIGAPHQLTRHKEDCFLLTILLLYTDASSLVAMTQRRPKIKEARS